MTRVLFFCVLISIQLSCGSLTSIEEQPKNSRLEKLKSKESNTHKKFVFIGDSLTAGYGVSEHECFVGIIKNKFKLNNIKVKIINAGISGEMSGGTLNRIDWILDKNVETVFLCIGGNDGLRGKSLTIMKSNIESMIKLIKDKKINLIFAGMKMPPNYSKEYTESFENTYKEIANKNKLKYLPFLLEGVAGKAEFNLPDGIHPNGKGHKKIAQNIVNFLRKHKVYLK